MTLPLSNKQLEFTINSSKKWNIAHGPVSSGKTIGTAFRFMQAVHECPDSQIWAIGHTSSTIYDNVIRLILEPQAEGRPDPLAIFRPFCSWKKGERELLFRDKVISTVGAKDSGAIGAIQGKTFSLALCDEATLYPENILDMIDTRLRNPHSMGFLTCNPSHPGHRIKQWINQAEANNPYYYSLQFMLDDNPYLGQDYKDRIKNSLSGVFYKRNYLGLWCLAEGAIFDFFDRDIYVWKRPQRCAEYWIAGIDDGTSNNFACVLLGVNSGKEDQSKPMLWVEKEFVWSCKDRGKALTIAEKVHYVKQFLENYYVKSIYIDPAAAALKLEFKRNGMAVVDADNDVRNGIERMCSEMQQGKLFVCAECKYTLREIESYVWDPKASEKGEDKPYKKDDHCFEENTKIITVNGFKKIKDIHGFDLVLTREGYKKVLKKHCKWGNLFKYYIHGHEIQCTEEHKFFTLNRDWVEVSNLIQSDILIIAKSEKECLNLKQKQLFSMEENTDVIRNLLITMTDDIITEQDTIYIEMFGNFITEKYRKDTIYITKTEIPLIIAYPISNVSQTSSISNYIKKIFEQINLQISPEMQQSFGINRMKAENGIENMQNVAISDRTLLKIMNVKSVENNIPVQKLPGQNFVRIVVNRNGEEKVVLIMSLELANFVIRNFQETDILKHYFAQSPVEGVAIGKEKRRVYDLTIEGCHEYFANGLLVHNCLDALRYAVYTHKISYFDYQSHGKLQNQYMQNRFSR